MHTSGVGSHAECLGAQYPHKWSVIPLTGILSLLQFMHACMFVGMCVFNHLLTLVWTHVSFIYWVIIQCYFYWFFCSNWSDYWELFSGFLYPFDLPHLGRCVVWGVYVLSIFLVSGITKYNIPGLSCVFPAPILEPAIFKESGSLYWTTELEAKIRVLAVHIAVGMSLIPGPLSQ